MCKSGYVGLVLGFLVTTGCVQRASIPVEPEPFQRVAATSSALRIVIFSDACFTPLELGRLSCSLLSLLPILKRYPASTRFKITGFSDAIFDARTAKTRSEQQAGAVAAWLWTQGISADRLIITGCGARVPLASVRHSQTSFANRRVEITLVGSDRRPECTVPYSTG
jgi:flagellar motor protein MotB